MTDLALAHATNYQLHCTQVIEVGPGSEPQMVHRDQWAFDMFKFPPGFDSTFATMWALTDFTEDNGATRVIPGSHKHQDQLQYGIADTIPAEMNKGSVLLYTGSLYHGAGANHTTQWRIGLIVHYSLACGAYSLGFIDGGRDAIAAVRPEFERQSEPMPEMNLKLS